MVQPHQQEAAGEVCITSTATCRAQLNCQHSSFTFGAALRASAVARESRSAEVQQHRHQPRHQHQHHHSQLHPSQLLPSQVGFPAIITQQTISNITCSHTRICTILLIAAQCCCTSHLCRGKFCIDSLDVFLRRLGWLTGHL